MTYEEQLKIEKINKEIINNIIDSVSKDEFIDFYKTHNRKETIARYGLRNDRMLIKILNIFEYDWSFRKSLKKGKKSTRSHESYISGGKKSSETQKQNWKNKTEEELNNWSRKQKDAHSSQEFKEKIKQINIDYQANLTPEKKEEIKNKKRVSNKKTWDEKKKQILEKEYNTKSKNNSWNTSKPEDTFYNYLLTKFEETDILRQYKDDHRYHHACDFYIKSKDLFIELNISWTHGGHKFDNTSVNDINKLASWKEKAVNSNYYKKAIETWTRLDVDKFNDAEKNKLNYLVFYTEEEAYNYEF